MNPSAHFAISRLAADDVAGDLGVTAAETTELPCVRGLPIRTQVGATITVVREWPNLAGRCEPFAARDIVRWDRALALEPQSQNVIARNTRSTARPDTHAEIVRWFHRIIRSIEQHQGIVKATPSETTRCILLTPWAIDPDAHQLPSGVRKVPSKLVEFPGGVIVSFDADRWDRREEYASELQDWFTDRVRQAKEGQQ